MPQNFYKLPYIFLLGFSTKGSIKVSEVRTCLEEYFMFAAKIELGLWLRRGSIWRHAHFRISQEVEASATTDLVQKKMVLNSKP